MLFVVPTPIGNLEDITMRAVRVLKEADLIACEDTRTSGVLLRHYGIETPTTSFHIHNEHKKTDTLVAQMAAGKRIALVSDAGTPAISDPGYLLVRACIRAGVEVEALPGATAFVPALVASGLPAERFVFEGFLPPKKGRQTRLKALAQEDRTVVIYESPHRLVKTLGQLAEHFGEDRPAVVARELSKKFETLHRGSLQQLIETFGEMSKVRGELVVLVGGADRAAPF